MDAKVLPSELQCPICSSLLEDAVMMPCCAGVYEGEKVLIISSQMQVLRVTPVPEVEF